GPRADLLLAELDWPGAGKMPDRKQGLKELEARVGSLPAGEQARALARLAEAAYPEGKPAEGERVCRLSLGRPAGLADRVPVLDLALQAGDEKLLGEVTGELRRQEGSEGTWVLYAEASARLLRLARPDKAALGEARELLAKIKERRPDWSR